MLGRQFSRRLRQERGQLLVVAALLTTTLLGFTGLVVDTGLLYSQRRQVQNAADESAMAAARILFQGSPLASARTAALEYAEANGFDNVTQSSVEVNVPPLSGDHQGDDSYVEVIVTEQPESFFIHTVMPGRQTVRARGVAGFELFPEPYALVVLEDHDCLAFDQEGQASMTVSDGGIIVNSDCSSDAFFKSGGGSLTVDGQIDVYGGYDIDGTGVVSPDPRTIPWTIQDPLASLTPPPLDDPIIAPGTAENPITWHHSTTENKSLSPGTYYGGILADCTCTITLDPGVYIMAGGGFTKEGGADIVGAEVMIYVTTNPTNPTGDGEPKGVRIAGSGSLALSPPLSGPYEGMTFWQDEAITDDFYMRGNNGSTQGLFYAPTATLNIAGGTTLGAVQLVVGGFELSGSGTLELNYGEWRTFESPKVVLVE